MDNDGSVTIKTLQEHVPGFTLLSFPTGGVRVSCTCDGKPLNGIESIAPQWKEAWTLYLKHIQKVRTGMSEVEEHWSPKAIPAPTSLIEAKERIEHGRQA
jgi:hypothetical protein